MLVSICLMLAQTPIKCVDHKVLREELAGTVFEDAHDCLLIVETFIT